MLTERHSSYSSTIPAVSREFDVGEVVSTLGTSLFLFGYGYPTRWTLTAADHESKLRTGTSPVGSAKRSLRAQVCSPDPLLRRHLLRIR